MFSNNFRNNNGFTIVELMVSIAIVAILTAVALPSLNSFTIRMKVDNEISELHRLLLTARNAAINSEQNVTICPLGVGNVCTGGNNWGDEISVFIDTNSNAIYEAGEELLKVKEAIDTSDDLEMPLASLTYTPSGQITINNSNLFIYCPSGYANYSRGIQITALGRVYTTSDTDNDDVDETRDGAEFVCAI